MTSLFIHGVPDTHRLWSPVLEALGEGDWVCPDMPGFGAPKPDGFSASMDAYADWLANELDAAVNKAGRPVHLVGHDWGGLLVQRVAGLHPDKVKSWAAGGVAIDEDYVWHDIAQIWQTPEEGEALMAAMDDDAMIAVLKEAQVPDAFAREMVEQGDDGMRASILSLYRSAVRIGDDWKDALPGLAQRPGLVLWGEHDPYASVAVGQKLAQRTDARFHLFEDCGHWWPYERAAEVAAELKAHWAQA